MWSRLECEVIADLVNVAYSHRQIRTLICLGSCVHTHRSPGSARSSRGSGGWVTVHRVEQWVKYVEVRRRNVAGLAASVCPHEVENADQTSGVVYREDDEPEVANVRDTPSWHPGRSAKHRVVRVVADPGQQRHEHVKRVLRKAVHLPERAGLQVRPVLHAGGRRRRM